MFTLKYQTNAMGISSPKIFGNNTVENREDAHTPLNAHLMAHQRRAAVTDYQPEHLLMQISVAVKAREPRTTFASAEDLHLHLSDSISDALSSVRYPIRNRFPWDRRHVPEFIVGSRHRSKNFHNMRENSSNKTECQLTAQLWNILNICR